MVKICHFDFDCFPFSKLWGLENLQISAFHFTESHRVCSLTPISSTSNLTFSFCLNLFFIEVDDLSSLGPKNWLILLPSFQECENSLELFTLKTKQNNQDVLNLLILLSPFTFSHDCNIFSDVIFNVIKTIYFFKFKPRAVFNLEISCWEELQGFLCPHTHRCPRRARRRLTITYTISNLAALIINKKIKQKRMALVNWNHS